MRRATASRTAKRACAGIAAMRAAPACAAATARATSAADARGTVAISSPVAGFRTGSTAPSEAWLQPPSISIAIAASPAVPESVGQHLNAVNRF